MASERSPKRQKTTADKELNTPDPTKNSSASGASNDTASIASQNSKHTQRSSWYASWSRKAPPITQVAKESIRSASNATSEAVTSIKESTVMSKAVRSPSLAMTLGKGRPSRASLADATTTMIHAEAKTPVKDSKTLLNGPPDKISASEAPKKPELEEQDLKADCGVNENATRKHEQKADPQQTLPNQRSTWLGWLGKAETETSEPNKSTVVDPNSLEEDTMPVESQKTEVIAKEMTQALPPAASVNKRGWLSLWPGEESSKSQPETSVSEAEQVPAEEAEAKKGNETSKSVQVKPQTDKQLQTVPPSSTTPPPSLPNDGSKASAWAFWSRERKANGSSTSVDKPHEGEIAISNTASQDHPRRTSISVAETKEQKKPEPTKPVSIKSAHQEAINSQDAKNIKSKSHKRQGTKLDAIVSQPESSSASAMAVEVEESDKLSLKSSTKTTGNLLLPSFHATLKLPESPSILLRLASLLYVSREPELKHLSLLKDPPRIKNAVAIGVHGYFPAPLVRTVLGQPTGTSIKFADMASRAIKRWTSTHGYECQVKTAALEGEGKIADRLDLLWKLLLNWIDEIRKADFIMVACHSQGVPVAIMLVAKLIQFGCVSNAKLSICAMAGVNTGPFQEYKSRWIGGSAGELFEFSNPASQVSTDYLAALDVVLRFGVRLTFIGSIDDQLVSLESSVFARISHPHIFRAVSIDGRLHAPNFLSHLVGFALKLRNLGIQDHGLIRELSSPLAGSLYTGEGHSRIYEDDAVYDLAVSFALETNSLLGIPIAQKSLAPGGSNPYILPFAMRGILEEDFVRNELQSEASDLLNEFDEWKPTSKVLKDVKFRLEGIRSKL